MPRMDSVNTAKKNSAGSGTVLQVVRNPGWLMPYIACAIGALGLIIHFGAGLLRFLNRGKKA